MTILEELQDFLDSNVREFASSNKERNIDMIRYHYGFGDLPLPTERETAKEFNVSKQWVDFIHKRDFQDPATLDHFSSLKSFRELVSEQDFWASSTLREAVVREDLAGESFSLRGLLQLLVDFRQLKPYQVYSPDLAEKSLRQSLDYPEFYILTQDLAPRLRPLLQSAKRFPAPTHKGQRGLARVEDLENANPAFSSHKHVMLEVIDRHPDSRLWRRNDGTWYLFDGPNNTLINNVRKALTAYEECDLPKLAKSIQRAQKRRGNPYGEVPVDLIEDYLQESPHIHADGNILRKGALFKENPPEPIESALVQFLRSNQGVSKEAAKAFLESRGRNKDSIEKDLYNSPLVFVYDSSDEDGSSEEDFTFYTVEPLDSEEWEESATDKRYLTLSKRLQELSKTDNPSEQQYREEQQTLRELLFWDRTTEVCALCRQEFSITALVAAHKKPRADCSEDERRDLNIVMPLCLFGCDYLYEKQYVWVGVDGEVKSNVSLRPDGPEQKHRKTLVGKQLEDRWLKGSPEYFRRPEA